MKQIVLLGLICAACFVGTAKAQSTSTKITGIEVDGKQVKKKYKVFFLSDGEWVLAKRFPEGFIVPSTLDDEEYLTILIEFGKYRLRFPDIHISNFTEDWVVGVDRKPFSDEYVKPEDAKGTNRAYYIRFEGSDPNRLLVITEKTTER